MKIYKNRYTSLPFDITRSHFRKNKIIQLYQDCRRNACPTVKFVIRYKKGKIPHKIVSIRRESLGSKPYKADHLYVIFISTNIDGAKLTTHVYNMKNIPEKITKIWPMRSMVKTLHKYTKPIYIKTMPI